MFEVIVSEFLVLFKGRASVKVFENAIVEFYVLGQFIWYIKLFCSSNIR